MSEVQQAQEQPISPATANASNGATGPRGIGGWLLVVAFGQVVGLIQLLVLLGQYYLDPENLKAFEQFPLVMYGELVMNLVLLLLALVTAILFFRKSTYFPRVFIGELVAIPAFAILGTVWVALAFSTQLGAPFREFLVIEQQDVVPFGLAVVAALIWIPYTLKSRRVKNTFAEPGALAGETSLRDEPQEQVLFRAVVYTVAALGFVSLVAGLDHGIRRGAISGQLVGGAAQIALAVWLFRGSNLARLVLIFLYGLGLVFAVVFALLFPFGQPTLTIWLAFAILCAAVFWALAFSGRFRAELAVNAAKYRKAEVQQG